MRQPKMLTRELARGSVPANLSDPHRPGTTRRFLTGQIEAGTHVTVEVIERLKRWIGPPRPSCSHRTRSSRSPIAMGVGSSTLSAGAASRSAHGTPAAAARRGQPGATRQRSTPFRAPRQPDHNGRTARDPNRHVAAALQDYGSGSSTAARGRLYRRARSVRERAIEPKPHCGGACAEEALISVLHAVPSGRTLLLVKIEEIAATALHTNLRGSRLRGHPTTVRRQPTRRRPPNKRSSHETRGGSPSGDRFT
jgi:hypothetical protein